MLQNVIGTHKESEGELFVLSMEVSIPTPQWGFNLSQTSQGFTQNGINPSGVYEKFKISHSIVCVASFDRENFVSRDCPIQVLPVTGYQLGVNPRPSYPNAIMANQTFGLGYQHPGLLLPNAFIPARPPVFGYQYGFNGLPYSNAIPITYQNHAYGNPILSPPISPISPSPYAQRSINFANATDSPFQMRQREPSGGVDYMRGGGSGQQGVGNYDEELRKAIEESELQFALEESKRLNQVEEKREFRMPEQSTSNPFADPV
ncbi:hypothetical protein HK098_004874 [Nowakowskiella sp. JEL0407]|nr:hypothetical protein HK098_004874 [Nowakowskiella sp. JEL0407]